MKFRKYCALRRVLYFLWLKDIFVDIYARIFYKPSLRKLQNNDSPKLLFFNSGHLGDALIMSYCFPDIKKKYPNIAIDVVCGEWCRFVFDKNPLVRNVIIQNHFMTNRSAISGFKKFVNHIKTAISAAKKLKQETYDFSIDVRHSGAVSHWILPFIKVKKSFGYGTRGYGGLLEKEFFLPENHFHSYDTMSILLKEIDVETDKLNVEAYLPFESENAEVLVKNIENLSNSILIFPESGGEIKMFNNDFWVKFCSEILEKQSCDLLFCGEKAFTKNLYVYLQNKLPQFKDRIKNTGKLRLSEVATLPQIAKAAITLDSFPAHLCSIFCKTLVLSKNAAGYQYFPLNNQPILMLHDHFASRSLNLGRKYFSSEYVETLNNIFEDETKMSEILEFLRE
jgi:heptosyltransferase III